jgi:hypothetical protein
MHGRVGGIVHAGGVDAGRANKFLNIRLLISV